MDYNADNIIFHCRMYWSVERVVCLSTVRSKIWDYFLKCRRWLDENSPPLCPVMRSHDLTNTSIFSHANLGSGDLILLTCAAIKLELFLEFSAVSVRLGSKLIFLVQNPFCATLFAQHLVQPSPAVGLRTFRGYHSRTGIGSQREDWGARRVMDPPLSILANVLLIGILCIVGHAAHSSYS